MNGYISVNEATERWNISERQVQKLRMTKRVPGVTRFSHAWVIPEDTAKTTRAAISKPEPKPKNKDGQEAVSDGKSER